MSECFLLDRNATGGSGGDCQIDFVDYKSGALEYSLSKLRKSANVITDSEGTIWIAGGYVSSTFIDTIDCFSPNGKLPSKTLSVGMGNGGAAVDGQGNVWIGGGDRTMGGVGSTSNDWVDKFKPDGTRTTHKISDHSTISFSHIRATTDGNGNVWFGPTINSEDVIKFTPDGVRSTYTSSTERTRYTAATGKDGDVWFIGGATMNPTKMLATIDRFSPNGVSLPQFSLSQARCNFASSTDGQGNVWVGGGCVDNSMTVAVSTVDKIAPSGARTTYQLSEARFDLAATTDGLGNVWFVGGNKGGSYSPTKVIDVFTPSGSHTIYYLSKEMQKSYAATDGSGNVWCISTGTEAIDVFTPNGVRLTGKNSFKTFLPTGTQYSINGDSGTVTTSLEKTFESYSPFNGYIKMKKSSL